jgi:phosphopantothenoylcysteine decarboxylase/phosphopantothenate--cysteine ligase
MFPKSVLLIITGSVASYKSLELIRLLRARNVTVTAILTRGGAQFITPLAVSSLTGTKTYSDLFSLTDEVEMGHIELSRVADMVLVAPASADILAKMAAGIADDLASTALLATNKPVVVAPAMNHKMWSHAATKRNVAQLKADGIRVIEPTEGDMACGEHGVGRMAEPAAIIDFLSGTRSGALAGKHAIVTSGATMEAIDPVRYLGNHSSGKQGHAIAAALAAQGARVTLISGNSTEAAPAGVTTLRATDAEAMLAAVTKALPADIFVGAAAVADWKLAKPATQKLKKKSAKDKLTLELTPTVDVLASIATHKKRPSLVIGFAAETEKLLEHARAKRKTKSCDWMLANHVANGAVFGAEDNKVTLVTGRGEEAWKAMSKQEVAKKLVQKITEHFASAKSHSTRLVKGKIA